MSDFNSKATEEDIRYCFRLLLGRNPNPVEVGHFSRVGADLEGVVRSYVTSLEFARRGFLDETIAEKFEIVLFDHFKIIVDIEDLDVGKHVLAKRYEPHIATLIKEELSPGMTFFDIGANVGFFSMLAASIVGGDGRVFSIEPNAKNIRMIEASRQMNNFTNLTALQIAAGDSIGVLSLNTSCSNGTTSPISDSVTQILNSTTVASFPLEHVLPDERPDVVKIDVEGAEYTALSGMRHILRRPEKRPVIISEFSPDLMLGISNCTGRDYLAFLFSFGYSVAVIKEVGDGYELVECQTDANKVMGAFDSAGVDHIDILAK